VESKKVTERREREKSKERGRGKVLRRLDTRLEISKHCSWPSDLETLRPEVLRMRETRLVECLEGLRV
jgi:hypothetical protein